MTIWYWSVVTGGEEWVRSKNYGEDMDNVEELDAIGDVGDGEVEEDVEE